MIENLYEEEAEQGSDNEEHDDIVKEIDREQELREEQRLLGAGALNPDANLPELIDDNAAEADNDDDDGEAYNKFLLDEFRSDKEAIKRIIDGEFRGAEKRKNWTIGAKITEEEDQQRRLKRLEEQMKQLEQQQDQEDYGDEEDEGDEGQNDAAGQQ